MQTYSTWTVWTLICTAMLTGCVTAVEYEDVDKPRSTDMTTSFDVGDGYVTIMVPAKFNAKLAVDRSYDEDEPDLIKIKGNGFLLLISTSSKRDLRSYFDEYYGNKFTQWLHKKIGEGDWPKMQQEFLALKKKTDLEIVRWLYSPNSENKDGYLQQMMRSRGLDVGRLGKYGETQIWGGEKIAGQPITLSWISLDLTDAKNKDGAVIVLYGFVNGERSIDGTLWLDRMPEKTTTREVVEGMFGPERGARKEGRESIIKSSTNSAPNRPFR